MRTSKSPCELHRVFSLFPHSCRPVCVLLRASNTKRAARSLRNGSRPAQKHRHRQQPAQSPHNRTCAQSRPLPPPTPLLSLLLLPDDRPMKRRRRRHRWRVLCRHTELACVRFDLKGAAYPPLCWVHFQCLHRCDRCSYGYATTTSHGRNSTRRRCRHTCMRGNQRHCVSLGGGWL